MDGATAPRWRGTARARRRWTESTTAMGGDGWRDGKLRVMEGAARWRGTAQPRWRLDGKGRCDRDGDSTVRDGTMVTRRGWTTRNRESAMAMSISTQPSVGAIKANAALNYKCSSLIKLNHYFIMLFSYTCSYLPPSLRYHAFSGYPNHDDSVHVNAWTTIVTPQTSSPMC